MKGSLEIIEEVKHMGWLDKQLLYLKYYSRHYAFKMYYGFGGEGEPATFDDFCSELNVQWNDVGEGWEKQGYAQQRWCNFAINSIYWWLHVAANNPNYDPFAVQSKYNTY